MKFKYYLLFKLSVIFMTFAMAASAQWVQTKGPYGGNVTAMTVSGTNLFAGTNGGGIFRSSDNGATWAAANNGLTSTTILALTANSKYIFAGTDAGGVFQSTDEGNSWTQTSSSLAYSDIPTLAIIGTNVLAGPNAAGVYRSTDYGKSWNLLISINTHLSVHSFAVIGSSLFASTSGGVYQSTDSGATWKLANGVLLSASAIYAGSSTNLFAIYLDSVYQSTNGGTSWTARKSGLYNGPADAFVVVGTKLFAGTNGTGVYLSSDSGKSWLVSNTGLINYGVSSLPVEGSNLFVETSNGTFLSTNDGLSWTSPGTGGVPSFQFNSFAEQDYMMHLFVYGSGGSIHGDGIYTSTDSGKNWSRINGWPYSFPVFAMAANDVALFASADSIVAVSFDNGLTWAEADAGLPLDGYYMISFAVMSNNIFVGANGGGVYMSSDNGASWNEVTSGLFSLFSFNALAASGTNLFAGTDGGIFVSVDSGKTWDAANTGLTDSNILSLAVIDSNLIAGTSTAGVWRSLLSDIEPSPYAIGAITDSLAFGNVLIGKDSSLYVTVYNTGRASLTINSIQFQGADSEFSHSAVTLPRTLQLGDSLRFSVIFTPTSASEQLGSLVVLSEAKVLSVPLSGSGINVGYSVTPQPSSLDFGSVILTKDSTLPVSLKNTGNVALTITAFNYIPLNVDFTNSTVILPATLQPGDALNFSITFAPLSLGAQKDTLIIVSEAKELGIPMTGIGAAVASVKDIMSFDTPLQSYPNPFSRSATIKFSYPSSGVGEVTIVNLLGAVVARLFDGELSAGEHSLTWDPKNASPGMYECVVRVNGSVQQIPLTLIR